MEQAVTPFPCASAAPRALAVLPVAAGHKCVYFHIGLVEGTYTCESCKRSKKIICLKG